MNKIEIKDLCLVFGKDGCVIAVNNVNLSIQEGEIFVIMGLSGSGKSTLLRCINGLKHRTSGEISINGTNITETSKKELIQMRRKVLAMVFLLEDILPLLTRTTHRSG